MLPGVFGLDRDATELFSWIPTFSQVNEFGPLFVPGGPGKTARIATAAIFAIRASTGNLITKCLFA